MTFDVSATARYEEVRIISEGSRVEYVALIGVFSWYYYQRPSNDLKVEAERLRDATERVLRMQQTILGGGKAEVVWDERGYSKGVAHQIEVNDTVDATDSARPWPRSAEDGGPERWAR